MSAKPRYREPMPQAIDVNEFRKVVTSRRSVRNFTDKPVPPEVLNDCLDMALLAPSSSGLQPWEFYVVKSPAKKAKLVRACMSQSAARTAAELIVVVARTDRIQDFSRKMLTEWPMPEVPKLVRRYYQLIPFNYTPGPLNSFAAVKKAALSVGGVFYPIPRGPFTHADLRLWAAKSTALASQNLMLAFRAHGFDTCPMEGFDAVRVNKLLGLPSEAFVVMVVGVGERTEEGVYFPQVRFDRKLFVHEV